MKRVLLTMSAVLLLTALHCPALAQDAGVPDTLYVEVYPQDQWHVSPGPWFVRFPIYVTHDIVDPAADSIAGFMIPLCFDMQEFGTVQYCSLSAYGNTTNLYPDPALDRSVFRHFIENGDTVIHNRMMDMSQSWDGHSGREWDFIVLDLGSQEAHQDYAHFWLQMVPTGSQDQRWWEGSRTLLTTMTFKVNLYDSLRLCIDTCFWPPSSRFGFSNSNAETYIPQHLMPVCETIGFYVPMPPYFTDCVNDQIPCWNGHYSTDQFTVVDPEPFGNIVSVTANFTGTGVSGVTVIQDKDDVYTGHVEYVVTDHCLAGGTIRLTATDAGGNQGWCEFEIVLGNDPPLLTAPDTLLAITGATCVLWVGAADANGDSVDVSFHGMWYEPDSLHTPTNAPSFAAGNPGLFSWVPTEAEEGPWICSFSATDVCGAGSTGRMTILVGPVFCGDNISDEIINVGDVIYLLNYLYVGGPAPAPVCKGDANCDGVTNVGDVIHLLNYLFKGGSVPCFNCCPE